MSSPSWEVQKAVYTALAANSGLTALLASGSASIVDGSAQDAAFPYVDLGEIEERDASTKSFVGGETFMTLHVWSDANGKKEIGDIFVQIKSSLNRQALSVTSNQLVDLTYENSRIFRDADGQTRHGVIQFRAITIES